MAIEFVIVPKTKNKISMIAEAKAQSSVKGRT